MQISPISPTQPTAPVDRPGGSALAQAAATNPKTVEPVALTPKVFTPAPPLRPNVQDYVDIDRTLIALRDGLKPQASPVPG